MILYILLTLSIANANPDNLEIDNILKLLNEGDANLPLSGQPKNLTLFLGNSNEGKTTLVRWMAGDDSLVSRELVEGTGDFIVDFTEDNTRKMFPKILTDPKTKTAFCDCPSFSDANNNTYDITSTYLTKKVIDYSQNLKIILVIDYRSVTVNEKSFMNLLKRLTRFIKNIEKFENSIAVVVTKVSNNYVKVKKEVVLVPHQNVTRTIAGFFKKVRNSLIDRDTFSKKAVKLLNILLMQENGHYSRIGILRKPDDVGPLNRIKTLQEGRNDAEMMLHGVLKFVDNENDFEYSVESKSIVHTLFDKIRELVWDDVENLVQTVRNRYESLFQSVTVDDIVLKTGDSFPVVNRTTDDVDINNVHNFREFSSAVNRILSSELVNVDRISKQCDRIEFFQTLSNEPFNFRSWKALLSRFKDSIHDLHKEYQEKSHSVLQKLYYDNVECMDNISRGIVEQFEQRVQSTSMEGVLNELRHGVALLSDLIDDIITREKVKDWLGIFENTLLKIKTSKLGTSTVIRNAYEFSKNGKYLLSLKVFDNFEVSTSKWVAPLYRATENLRNSAVWMKFLNELFWKFSEYDIQTNKSEYGYHLIKTTSTRSDFSKFLSNFGLQVPMLNVTDNQLEKMRNVVDHTLGSTFFALCDDYGTMVIQGSYVLFSQLTDSSNNLLNICNFTTVSRLDIFSLLTVFIDRDLRASGVRVRIVTPKWEVIGKREINLDGGVTYEMPGVGHGLAGVPGKPGGSFLGIGLRFINGGNLTISSRGGPGGRGQNGGDGQTGRAGSNANTSGNFPKTLMEVHDYNFTYCEKFKLTGEAGGPGGNGGDGGVGGEGGLPGEVSILLGKSDLPLIRRERGPVGVGGDGGRGGPGGKDGDDLEALFCTTRGKGRWANGLPVNVGTTAAAGRKGIPGVSQLGKREPAEPERFSSDVVEKYKNFVSDELPNFVKTDDLSVFIKDLGKIDTRNFDVLQSKTSYGLFGSSGSSGNENNLKS